MYGDDIYFRNEDGILRGKNLALVGYGFLVREGDKEKLTSVIYENGGHIQDEVNRETDLVIVPNISLLKAIITGTAIGIAVLAILGPHILRSKVNLKGYVDDEGLPLDSVLKDKKKRSIYNDKIKARLRLDNFYRVFNKDIKSEVDKVSREIRNNDAAYKRRRNQIINYINDLEVKKAGLKKKKKIKKVQMLISRFRDRLEHLEIEHERNLDALSDKHFEAREKYGEKNAYALKLLGIAMGVPIGAAEGAAVGAGIGIIDKVSLYLRKQYRLAKKLNIPIVTQKQFLKSIDRR